MTTIAMRRTALIAFLSIFCIQTSAYSDANDSKSLRIGAVLSLTGDAANNGEAIRKGMELALEEIRKEGWKTEANVQDDATIPTRTVSSFQYLASKGFRIFIGPTWSFETKAARPLIEKIGAITISPPGSSEINGGASRAIFNMCPSRMSELSVLSGWLKSKTYKKAFILTPLGDWGLVHRSVFQSAASEAGLEIVGDEQFDYGLEAGAVNTIMLRAKSKGADLILTTASGGDVAVMLKARGHLHWKVGFVSADAIWDALDSKLIAEDSPLLEDVWTLGLPMNGSFYKKFYARFSEAPRMYSDRAYDAVMLLSKAVAATDGSPDKIRRHLASGFRHEGVTGTIEFNEKGDRIAENYAVMAAMNNRERK